MLALSGVAVGRKVKLVALKADMPMYRHKLLAMGLTPGVEIKMLSKAPFGGPVKIALRGYQLSLRPSECQSILVESLNECCKHQVHPTDHRVCGQP